MKEFFAFIILILSFLLLNSCAKTYLQKGWKCEKAGDNQSYNILFQAIKDEKVLAYNEEFFLLDSKLVPVSWEDGRFCIVEQDSSPQGIYDSRVKPEYCYNWLENYISKKRKEGFICTGPKKKPDFSDSDDLMLWTGRTPSPKTQPEETQPEETQPEETQPEETQPEEEGSTSFWGEGF